MADVKWIKLSTDVFNNEKFDAIRTMPDCKDIMIAWIELLCLAGKCNEGGLLMVTRELPYTDEMLAQHFRMEVGIIQRALTVFQQLNMVEVVDSVYQVSNWTKYQSADRLEEMRKKDRERKREAKKKQLETGDDNNTDDNSTEFPRNFHGICSSSNSLTSNNPLFINSQDNNTNSINTNTDSNNSIKSIISAWNELSDIGIKPVRSISSGSKRNDMLRARVREHGADTVIEAINRIRDSDFLQGKGSRGWVITFDWFLLPSNFQKVLEGNYDNSTHNPTDKLSQKFEEMKNW